MLHLLIDCGVTRSDSRDYALVGDVNGGSCWQMAQQFPALDIAVPEMWPESTNFGMRTQSALGATWQSVLELATAHEQHRGSGQQAIRAACSVYRRQAVEFRRSLKGAELYFSASAAGSPSAAGSSAEACWMSDSVLGNSS